jgi:hypothetical protein
MIKHQAVYNTHSTVVSLSSDALTALDANGNSVTLDQTLVDAEAIKLQAAYDAQAYARNRKVKYDALNQFELISDDSINGTTTHKDAITAIKAEFPKP